MANSDYKLLGSCSSRSHFICNLVKSRRSPSNNSLIPMSPLSDASDVVLKGSFLPVVAIKALPDGCRKKNNAGRAEARLVYILKNALRPNASTFTALIDSYCKEGKLKQAFQVLQLMQTKHGCRPTTETYNCLLRGLCYVGKVEESYRLLFKMKDALVKPDGFSYSIVMHGFCKVGRTDEALELLEEAILTGLSPTVAMFNALLHGYSKEGRPLEGFEVLKRMRGTDCIPDSIVYSTLLHGLVLWGHTRSALEVYKEMVGAGLAVDKSLKKGLLKRLCRVADLSEYAYHLFGEMSSDHETVDHGIGSLMIRSLCHSRRADDAWTTLQLMVGYGLAPRLVIWNFVIQALCSHGNVDEACRVLVVLYEVNRMPSRTSYDLLIHELNLQGRSLAARLLFAAALVRGVTPARHPTG